MQKMTKLASETSRNRVFKMLVGSARFPCSMSMPTGDDLVSVLQKHFPALLCPDRHSFVLTRHQWIQSDDGRLYVGKNITYKCSCGDRYPNVKTIQLKVTVRIHPVPSERAAAIPCGEPCIIHRSVHESQPCGHVACINSGVAIGVSKPWVENGGVTQDAKAFMRANVLPDMKWHDMLNLITSQYDLAAGPSEQLSAEERYFRQMRSRWQKEAEMKEATSESGNDDNKRGISDDTTHQVSASANPSRVRKRQLSEQHPQPERCVSIFENGLQLRRKFRNTSQSNSP
jgi:hypothetical protein